MSYISREIPQPSFLPQSTQSVRAFWPVIGSVLLALIVMIVVSLDNRFSEVALASMGP